MHRGQQESRRLTWKRESIQHRGALSLPHSGQLSLIPETDVMCLKTYSFPLVKLRFKPWASSTLPRGALCVWEVEDVFTSPITTKGRRDQVPIMYPCRFDLMAKDTLSHLPTLYFPSTPTQPVREPL